MTARAFAYLFIGIGFAAIALGTWAGAGLAACGFLMWAMHPRSDA